MPDAALLERIRAVLSASPFHGEGHRKVWARLRIGGVRTSLRRLLRLMRENKLLAPGRVGRPRGPRNHDGTIDYYVVGIDLGAGLSGSYDGRYGSFTYDANTGARVDAFYGDAPMNGSVVLLPTTTNWSNPFFVECVALTNSAQSATPSTAHVIFEPGVAPR